MTEEPNSQAALSVELVKFIARLKPHEEVSDGEFIVSDWIGAIVTVNELIETARAIFPDEA